jgi:hypothetical protein
MPTYEQMLREHQALDADLRSLEQAYEDPAALFARLGPLRETLARHFAHEEEGGYLKVVTDTRPGLALRVDELKAQHQQILAALDSAVGLGATSSELRGSVEAALAQLRAHERAENELVTDVVNEDIGGDTD